MYLPKKYQKKDKTFIFELINAHPFATIVSQGSRLMATHLPILTEGSAEDFLLYSHLAKHNEQSGLLKDGAEVLVIFQAAQAYISSSWYQEKDISTWDYSAVHINAKIKLQTQEELAASLEKLVHHFEKSQETPQFYKDIPSEMLEEHLPLIQGFQCIPQKIEAIAKFHQGYAKEDIRSVVRHLEQQKEPQSTELAKEIRKENGL